MICSITRSFLFRDMNKYKLKITNLYVHIQTPSFGYIMIFQLPKLYNSEIK